MKRLIFVFLTAAGFAADAPPPSAGLALAQMRGSAAPAQKAPPAAPKPEVAGDSRYELDGILVLDQPSVLIADLQKENARWLKVGEKFGDLEVVSVDQKANTAAVKISGESKTLPLKKATIGTSIAITTAPNSPGQTMPAGATPTATSEPQAPQAPMTLEDREAKEAREFVSDLLEIGIQQRRAWEEKQASAAKTATQ